MGNTLLSWWRYTVEELHTVTMVTTEDKAFKAKVVKSYGVAGESPVKTSVVCVAPADDVVVVCHGEKVAVYRKTGEKAGELTGHRAEVTACSISHDLLATASSSGIIILWKYREMKRVARIGLPAGPINSCALSVTGRYLAVSYADRKPRVYTVKGDDGALLGGPTYKELEGHGKCPVTDIKFSTMSDDNLMTAAKDGTIKFWKVAAGECLATIDLPEEGPIMQVEFLKGTGIAILTETGGLSVFNLDSCEREFNVALKIKVLAAGSGSSMVAFVDKSDTLYVYNLATQKEVVKKGTTHEGSILSAAMCYSGSHFITSGADGKCLLWD